jgi:hypothetical protein
MGKYRKYNIKHCALASFSKNATLEDNKKIFFCVTLFYKNAAASYSNCFIIMKTKGDHYFRAQVPFTFSHSLSTLEHKRKEVWSF